MAQGIRLLGWFGTKVSFVEIKGQIPKCDPVEGGGAADVIEIDTQTPYGLGYRPTGRINECCKKWILKKNILAESQFY